MKTKYQLRKERDHQLKNNLENKTLIGLCLKIDEYDLFNEDEKNLILKINDNVMNAAGIAEGWGGYSFDPLDYIGISVEIFQITKKYFTNGHN